MDFTYATELTKLKDENSRLKKELIKCEEHTIYQLTRRVDLLKEVNSKFKAALQLILTQPDLAKDVAEQAMQGQLYT